MTESTSRTSSSPFGPDTTCSPDSAAESPTKRCSFFPVPVWSTKWNDPSFCAAAWASARTSDADLPANPPADGPPQAHVRQAIASTGSRKRRLTAPGCQPVGLFTKTGTSDPPLLSDHDQGALERRLGTAPRSSGAPCRVRATSGPGRSRVGGRRHAHRGHREHRLRRRDAYEKRLSVPHRITLETRGRRCGHATRRRGLAAPR